MRKLLFLPAIVLLVNFENVVRANEEAAAIIDKAIKAHGGLEALKKLEKKGSYSKSEGKLHQFGGVDIAIESMAQYPDKFKVTTDTEIMGMAISQVQVFNGEDYAMIVNGMDVTAVLGDSLEKEIKEQMHQEKLAGLAFLKDASVKLSPLGEVTVEGKPALGVRASTEGHRDVSMFFDKESGMLVKVEARVLDLQTQQEVTQASIHSEHTVIEGVKQPSRIVITKDGEAFIELEIVEIKYVDKFDDSEFEIP